MEKIVKLLEMNYLATVEANFKHLDWGLITYGDKSLNREFTAYVGDQKVIGKLTVLFIDADISVRYKYKNVEDKPPVVNNKSNKENKLTKEK